MTMINMLARHPGAVLTAVCDKYGPALEKVRAMADEKGIKVSLYENFDEFFQHGMDAVVLANYANEHAPFAIKLLKSGRHVMSEVLPCETMAQAVELIEAVECSGKIYSYAENYCYMKGPFEMRRRYENGDIGEIQYAEGEYIHDCSAIWPQITYGEKGHWRNRSFPTFYNTHSLGPLITITGLRPVSVTGFRTNTHMNRDYTGNVEILATGGAIEMVTLENGAVVKSIHGGLKREPGSINYEIYGTRGMMETDRWDGNKLSVYMEKEKLCRGDLLRYEPEPFISSELSGQIGGHGGSDFYTVHFFIEKILGNPDGAKYGIDVYAAADMGICGILAYRSILNGNAPVKVPNLRIKRERDAFRDDNACANPAVAGNQLLPAGTGMDSIPDESYDYVRRLWLDGKNAE
jgi:predicted dehydrogenase